MVNGEPIREAPMVVVRPGGEVLVDGQLVRRSSEAEMFPYTPDDGFPVFEDLFDILKRKRELWSTFNPRKAFPGVVLLEIDGDAPTSLVKRVVASCALAGYPELDFLAVQLPT